MLFKKNIRRNFGILQDYRKRAAEKLIGTHKVMASPKFFTTPTRPSNYGDHLDLKVTIDNWFEENRVHNEAAGDTDIRRT